MKLFTTLSLRLNGSLNNIHGLASCEKRVVFIDTVDAGNVFKGLHHTLLALTSGCTWFPNELIYHIVERVNVSSLNR